MSETDNFLTFLILRTPHVDALVELLQKEGFPTARKHICNGTVTQYLKTRRLYDILFQHCFTYDPSEKQKLKHIFQRSGNSYAGALLFSSRNPYNVNSHIFWLTAFKSWDIIQHNSDVREGIYDSTNPNPEIFVETYTGNVTELEILLKMKAATCIYSNLPADVLDKGENELEEYISQNLAILRTKLRHAILTEKYPNMKSLLHAAVESKSAGCMDLILRYAQEAGIKGHLLDSQDKDGSTPLHVALQRRHFRLSKMLISEGANIYLMDNKQVTSLQIIYSTLPKVALHLLDTAVTVEKDDLYCDHGILDIDFRVLCAHMDIKESQPIREYKPNSPNATLGPTTQNALYITVSAPSSVPTPYFEFQRRKEEMQTLASLVYNDVKSCSLILTHPVARLFLKLKWKQLKHIIYLNLALRLCLLTVFLYIVFKIYFIDCTRQISGNMTEVVDTTCSTKGMKLVVLPIIISFCTIFFCTEIFRIPAIVEVSRFKTYWVGYLGIGAWMRIIFYIVAIITTVVPLIQTHFHSYEYIIAVAGVLMCTVLILQVIGDSNLDFGFHSIYIHVYTRVLWRFVSVILTFSSIILGFAISFNIIFPQNAEFSTFGKSLFRTIMMVHGEFGTEDKLLEAEGNENKMILWTIQIMYILFGSVATLVLIDVFLGYTVSDVNELRNQAKDMKRFIQIQQVFLLETFFATLKRILPKKFCVDAIIPNYSLIQEKEVGFRSDVAVKLETLSEQLQKEFGKFVSEN